MARALPQHPVEAHPHVTAIPAARSLAPTRRPAIGRITRTRGRVLGLGIIIAALVPVLIASLAVGSREIDPATVVRAFLAPDGSFDQRTVLELRIPRTVIGVFAGVALGMSGLLMQGLTRNPLADPGLLGVSAGASFVVVLSIAFLGSADPATYVWFALAGAALATMVVHLLGRGRGRIDDPVRLVLAGWVLSALLEAGISAILVTNVETLDKYRFWVVGSLSGRTPGSLEAVLPLLVVGIVIAVLATRPLNALGLGDDVARGLGARVGPTRLMVSVGIVLLAGASVVLAGPIVFVGMAVPLVARSLVGADNRWLMPYCAILGILLVVGADTLGRVVIRPAELQVGIVTALLGAPLLVAVVRTRRLASV